MIKLLSLFSGIGAFEKALGNLGIPFELVNYCEIDKYASKSYSAIHGVSEDMNLWDVTKVDTSLLPKDLDLVTYGFPCQDISSAGMQKGMFNADGTHTRSGLFFEALRIIEATKPKVAIAENVKNLTSKKFREQFDTVLTSLENAGYNNYWQVLNARDYGIPQNRERVFIISIRKDVDDRQFEFPKPFPLEYFVADFLEDEVEEKFYINTPQAQKLLSELADSGKLEKAVSNAIRGGQRFNRPTSMGFDKRATLGVFSEYAGRMTKATNTAITLMARDYKGFGRQEMNGVIECKTEKTIKAEVVGRVLSTTGKKHEKQEVYNAIGGADKHDTCNLLYRTPKSISVKDGETE